MPACRIRLDPLYMRLGDAGHGSKNAKLQARSNAREIADVIDVSVSGSCKLGLRPKPHAAPRQAAVRGAEAARHSRADRVGDVSLQER